MLAVLTVGITPLSTLANAESISKTLDSASSEDVKCLEAIQKDSKRQYESYNKDNAIDSARSDDRVKSKIGADNIESIAVTQGWNIDPVKCTAELIETNVHFIAIDSHDEKREIIVKEDPNSFRPTDVFVILESEKPKHATATSANWAGYSIKGASTEASSEVYSAYLAYTVPTPNDPTPFDCSTGNERCFISVWTGISRNLDGSGMVQTGTDSICTGNNCSTGRSYTQWFELVNLSNQSTSLTCATDLLVSAGDSMAAQVTNGLKDGGSSNSYDLYLINITDNRQCTLLSQTGNYGTPRYAEYIVERPNFSGNLAKLAQYSTISNMYGTIYYGGSSKGIYTPYSQGSSWYHDISMLNSGNTNISNSAITSLSKFTSTWLTSQGAD